MATTLGRRRRRAHYPWGSIAVVPPDPGRTSSNAVIYAQRARYAPLEVYCCAECVARGKARPEDNGCRHVDQFLAAIKPWWRSRARVVGAEAGGAGQKREAKSK